MSLIEEFAFKSSLLRFPAVLQNATVFMVVHNKHSAEKAHKLLEVAIDIFCATELH